MSTFIVTDQYEEIYAALQEQYPDEITTECDKWQSRRTVDNFGLLKSYLCYDAESHEIAAENYDIPVQDLYNSATVKSDISTLPDTVGTAVINGDTLGIYVGNGEVIEAMNTLKGVTKTKLAGQSWTHWLQIPYISYVNLEEENENESALEE